MRRSRVSLLAVRVPSDRLAVVARFARTVNVDAFDFLDLLLNDSLVPARQADPKAGLRPIELLANAATTLAETCRRSLDLNLPNGQMRQATADGISAQAQALKAPTRLNLVCYFNCVTHN